MKSASELSHPDLTDSLMTSFRSFFNSIKYSAVSIILS